MKVEQRIGRLHRLGQEHDVSIFSFSTNDTVEATVLEILAQKIRMFELVIGETDMILGLANMGKSFEELITAIWLGSRSRDEARERLEQVGDQFLAAREKYQKVRDTAELLSDVQETLAGADEAARRRYSVNATRGTSISAGVAPPWRPGSG